MLVYRSGLSGTVSWLEDGQVAGNGKFTSDLNKAKIFNDTRHFFNYMRYHNIDPRLWSQNGVLVRVSEVVDPRYQTGEVL